MDPLKAMGIHYHTLRAGCRLICLLWMRNRVMSATISWAW